MSDRIAVMSGGRIRQLGTPEEIYRRPSDRFVASFIGDTNVLRGRLDRAEGAHAIVSLGAARIKVPSGPLQGDCGVDAGRSACAARTSAGDRGEPALRAQRHRRRPGLPGRTCRPVRGVRGCAAGEALGALGRASGDGAMAGRRPGRHCHRHRRGRRVRGRLSLVPKLGVDHAVDQVLIVQRLDIDDAGLAHGADVADHGQ